MNNDSWWRLINENEEIAIDTRYDIVRITLTAVKWPK